MLETVNRANPEAFAQDVRYLANRVGPRSWSEPALLEETAQWIAGRFRDLGWHVSLQPFTFRKRRYYNVEASAKDAPWSLDRLQTGVGPSSMPGSGPGSGQAPAVVVGAHYDSVRTTPGADDNASGVAGLLELARLLSPREHPNLRLVAFCLEEPPAYRTRNMGSFHYASALKGAGIRLRGMICLEMIGFFSDEPGSQSFPLPFMRRFYPDRGDFIGLVGTTGATNWTKEVEQAFRQGTSLPCERLNAPFFVVGVDLSDHWAFTKHGYPAMMVTDTAFYRNPHYHRPSDLPETLDMERAAKVVDGVATAASILSNRQL